MNEQKAKFTWHYYVMASGALLAMLAGTLGSVSGVITGLSLSLVSLPRLPLKTLTRLAFMAAFVGLYVFSFPDPDVVREKMAGQHIPMDPALMAPSRNAEMSAPSAELEAKVEETAPAEVDIDSVPVVAP